MQPSQNCYSLIKQFEGLYLEAYDDTLGVITIGYGTIKYPNGEKIKLGDTCTETEAEQWLELEVNEKATGVDKAIKEVPINQGQYDSLVSFAYNLGIGALQGSTLLKKLLKNPHDVTIYQYQLDAENKPVVDSCEFLKWVRGNGKVMNGLVRRRAAEADMYAGK